MSVPQATRALNNAVVNKPFASSSLARSSAPHAARNIWDLSPLCAKPFETSVVRELTLKSRSKSAGSSSVESMPRTKKKDSEST
jgi:hypothetical protein